MNFVDQAVEAYAEQHSTPLPPLLQELMRETHARFGGRAGMLSGHLTGMLLQMLVGISGARRVLEVGMFTGFSGLLMAEALPEDGTLTTCELEPAHADLARSFFDRSPHGRKIDVRMGPALDTLKGLQGPYDFVFIDADKENYTAYYEEALRLLAPHGVIAIDNTLWSGRVLNPRDERDRAVVACNEQIRNDPRGTCVVLTVRDGVTLIRRRNGSSAH